MSGLAGYLPLLWSAVAAVAILAYAFMDGWVLGIGILYPLMARQADRDLVIQAIARFWKPNETLFVFGAMLLLVGLPTAHSRTLTQLCFPILAMLFALVVRRASYVLLHQGSSLRRIWELAFAGGCMLAALAQGYLAGRLIQGFGGNDVTSGLIGWLRVLFPILCSLGLLGSYGLLGACWLIFKADGALQVMGREVSHSALILAATSMVAVCFFIPMVGPPVAHRWLDPAMRIVLALFTAAGAAVIWQLWRSLWLIKDYRPLQWAVVLFMLAFTGIVVGLYPYLVPYQFTSYELAYAPAILKFAGVGLCVVLTIIILCVLLGYRSLRGKIPPADTRVGEPSAIVSRKTCGHNVDLHLS
jgi:cytochrome bd ubiquinol oxidase subunit II